MKQRNGRQRKGKQILISAILILNILILAACANKTSTSTEQSSDSASGAISPMEEKAQQASPEMGYASDAKSDGGGVESATQIINDTSQVTGQKLIKEVSLSVETRTFDDFTTTLTTQIESLGGYVESSDASGGSYEYNNYRSGYLVARIPAEKLDGFVTLVKEKGNVIRSSEQTTDVTLQYVDTQSRLKALRIEQDTLLGLLENATKMEDIIAIQSQLTQVRYEIESKESQMRTFDNQVNYSTVRIDFTEVERETATETKSFSNQIKAKFSDNVYAIKEGFKNFLIALISSLPFIVLWGIIIAVLVVLGKRIYKKRYKHIKNKEKLEENNGEHKSE